MGLMRFIAPPDRITEEVVQQAYLSGFDRVPWQVRAQAANGELVLERGASDSGSLNIPWLVESYGEFTLSTGTLMERSEAYYLPLELARGRLGQLRNQLAEWEGIGLIVPESVRARLSAATAAFVEAACGEQGSSRSIQKADEAIRLAIEASNLLTAAYIEQALAVRRRTAAKLPTFLGANLGLAPLDAATSAQYLEAFNAVAVPLAWRSIETSEGTYRWEISDRQIEWARTHGLTLCAGPLLEFNQRKLPDWLALYEDDFESIFALASEFVKAAVKRYRGKVDLWQCAARVNTDTALSLSEEDKIKLAARSIEITRVLDPRAALVVSFDQPWGEYLSRRKMDFPPLQFADALIRADLGLNGLMLEMNVGYCPGGTQWRDPLEFSRQLDYWSALGVPLYLTITVPSDTQPDPQATRKIKVTQPVWDARSQQTWVARHLPVFLAKTYVQGILWGQLRDLEPHEFPHGGLYDLQRRPKPALRQLAALRKAYLR
jgi:hypothetical protein